MERIIILKAIIFDFADTLIDTHDFFTKVNEINKSIFESFGINISLEDIALARNKTIKKAHKHWKKNAFPGFFSYEMCIHLGVNISYDTCRKMDLKFAQLFIDEVTLKPFVKEALQFLKGKGYKIGLLATYDHYSVLKILEKIGVESFFDAIVTLDETGVGKTDILPYKMILKKLQVQANQCVMVGDKEYDDVVIPKRLKMRAIKLCETKADYYIESFREMLGAIEKL